jgi:hypothetical protein
MTAFYFCSLVLSVVVGPVLSSLLKIQGKDLASTLQAHAIFHFFPLFENLCEGRQELLTWQTFSSWSCSSSSPKDGTV